MRVTPFAIVSVRTRKHGVVDIIADFINAEGRSAQVGCYGIDPSRRVLALDALSAVLDDSSERTQYSNVRTFASLLGPYGDVAP